jgi:hypothetical protein
MEIMKTERKGRHLNTLETYYIYKVSKDKIQMNNTNDIYNPIFEALHNIKQQYIPSLHSPTVPPPPKPPPKQYKYEAASYK